MDFQLQKMINIHSKFNPWNKMLKVQSINSTIWRIMEVEPNINAEDANEYYYPPDFSDVTPDEKENSSEED